MSKTIATLSSDIYTVLDSSMEHDHCPSLAGIYSKRIGEELAKSTEKRSKPREKGKLWASDLGKPCLRQHWYNFNMPEAGDPLLGHTKFKFLYGNLLEEAVLYLAEEAGHDVSHQQHRVEASVEQKPDWSISGRIDAIIDGVLVDVKSTSSFGYNKYKWGINAGNDSFGYIQQLSYYDQFGEYDIPHTEAGFVWIDKQNGHIKYTGSPIDTAEQLQTRAGAIVDAIETDDEQVVPRGFESEPYGKSGNQALSMPCSYCAFKAECWKDANNNAGPRTFTYGHKIVHLVEVKREPKVPEVHNGGK